MNDNTLAQLCLSSSAKYKDKIAFSMFSEGEIRGQVTYTQLGTRARQISSSLRQLGVKNGGRVLLFSDNCPEWPLAYFGIAIAGAVSVPLLTGFSTEQIQFILDHSGVSAICLSREMSEKFDHIAESSLANIPLLYIDSLTEENNTGAEISISINGIEKQLYIHAENECPDYSGQNPDDLATIIYTSGTQGNSKGVMLSNKNIIFSAKSSFSFVSISPRDRVLSVLPLAHSYECSLGLLGAVICGASVTYLDRPPSSSVLLPALKKIRPTIMTTVPLLIEKIYYNAIAPKLKTNKLYKFPLTRPLA
ncbi:MAG: long-chain fatty acid--CoA ligase, partial [Treponema sp.]|nr:long-chain fatty acid--CoA ligase [Treponema sp.]